LSARNVIKEKGEILPDVADSSLAEAILNEF